MKALAYVRVSKIAQELSPEAQRAQLEAYCTVKGYDLMHVFEESGVSGGKELRERPEGAWLFALAGEVDAIIFAKVDRAFRDTVDCIMTTDALISAGKSVHFLDLGIDTSTPAGELFMTVIAAFAQFERRRISERITEALAVVKQQGRHIGSAPYGFRNRVRIIDGRRVDAGLLEPVAAEGDTLQRVKQMRGKGATLRQIADALTADEVPTRRDGRWSPEMVRRIAARGES